MRAGGKAINARYWSVVLQYTTLYYITVYYIILHYTTLYYYIIIIITAATVPCAGSLVLSRGSLYRILAQHSPHTCYSLSTSQATEGLIFTDKYLFPLAYERSLPRRNWCMYIYMYIIIIITMIVISWYIYIYLSYYHHDRFYSHWSYDDKMGKPRLPTCGAVQPVSIDSHPPAWLRDWWRP